MTLICFVILNIHVTAIYLRFIKSTYFYVLKQKIWKLLYFSLLFIFLYTMCLFWSKKAVSKIEWLVKKPGPIFVLYEVRPECLHVLSNLVAEYTMSVFLCLNIELGGVNLKIVGKKRQVYLIITEWPKNTSPHFNEFW